MAKVLIVAATFYKDIADELIKGASKELKAAKIPFDIIEVPGAFEIPAAISMASGSEKYDGYVALGCVIRGETTHYDYVCMESARGLNELAVKCMLPIGYGIITVENFEQAWDRAKVNKKNKGGGAAIACIEMMKIRKKFVK